MIPAEKKDLIYGAQTAHALMTAIILMADLLPCYRHEKERYGWIKGSQRPGFIASSRRADIRRWAKQALDTPVEHPDHLDNIAWAKAQLKTGGLGEHYNSPERLARARLVLACRQLRKDYRKLTALAIALYGPITDEDIIFIAMSCPTCFQLAHEAKEILNSENFFHKGDSFSASTAFFYREPLDQAA